MSLKIANYSKIINRISQYYINAKQYKYPNSCDWSEVFNDIHLAQPDKNLIPCSKSKPEWEKAGYTVIRNSRDWAFACVQEGEDILILDADNCECLTVDNTHTYNLSFLDQLRSTSTSTLPTMRKSIGYGWWAIRAGLA